MKDLKDLLKLEKLFEEPVFCEILISNNKLFLISATPKKIKVHGLEIDEFVEDDETLIKNIKKINENKIENVNYFG